MADLTLELLGGFRGQFADGRELTLPTKKGWALLSYLALHPDQKVGREKLAALLWGERFEDQARGSLRQTLYEVRTALGDDLASCIEANRATVALTGGRIAVDALRFEKLAESGQPDHLVEAEMLYRGALLEGFETGEQAFAEWLNAARLHYQAVASRTLEALTASRLAQRDHEGAISASRRLVGIEPLSEHAHRLFMDALAAAGRRSEALKHYRDLEQLLATELAVEPDAATRDLRDRLASVRADGPETPEPDASAPAMPEPVSATARARAHDPWLGGWRLAAACAAVVLAIGVGFLLWHPWKLGLEPASVQRMAYPLPDKPSIVVLPFDNYSDDPKLDLFGSGLTEDLTAALSKAPGLFVIARNSAATYKGEPVDIKQVAEELGVQYVLEGSVRKSGDKLRITTQLIDALDGHQLWADRFDRDASDVFALQDEIVKRVFVELQVKLTQGDAARVASRGTNSLEAWLARVEGHGEFVNFTREGMVRARELFEAAQRADPGWARAVAAMASVHWYEAKREWSASREESIRLGMELAERAIEMDPYEPLGYMALGNLLALQGDAERAIAARRKAAELAPNDFIAVAGLATRLKDLDQPQEAIELFERGMRLSPKHPWWVPSGYALALHLVGRKDEAVEFYTKANALRPHVLTYARLAALYADLGEMGEARATAEEVMRLDPNFTIAGHMRGHSLHDPERDAWYRNLLTRAGLPE